MNRVASYSKLVDSFSFPLSLWELDPLDLDCLPESLVSMVLIVQQTPCTPLQMMHKICHNQCKYAIQGDMHIMCCVFFHESQKTYECAQSNLWCQCSQNGCYLGQLSL